MEYMASEIHAPNSNSVQLSSANTARAISLTQLLGQMANQPGTKSPTPPSAFQPSTSITASGQALAAELDAARLEMFGRYYEDLEARMQALHDVVESGLARSRQSVLDKVQELSSALHRDLVAMRQEQQRELEDLKRDVFTAVMSLSAVNDRISALERNMQEPSLSSKANSVTLTAMPPPLATPQKGISQRV
jgi:hypothetical protein